MANQDTVFSVRLKINDPAGVISIIQVATPADLPAAPVPQAAYFVASTGQYVKTAKLAGATSTDYSYLELMVADAVISAAIDAFGESAAISSCIRRIISQLAAKFQISSHSNGGDSVNFTALRDMISFYKDLLSIYETEGKETAKNSSGRIGRSKQPEIAGGLN